MKQNFWSQTYSGRSFDYDLIEQNEFHLEDIAHQLSMVNRYGGACTYPYSVAQHSCALAVTMMEHGFPARECLYALFHDAAEAYTGDIRTPLKDNMPGCRVIEDKVQTALLKAMNAKYIPVPLIAPHRMKEYDRRIVNDEKAVVMNPCMKKWYGMEGFPPLRANPTLFREMPWNIAKQLWLTLVEEFSELTLRDQKASNVVRLHRP